MLVQAATLSGMLFVLPPTPSSDFFVIGFANGSRQKARQGHAQYVNEGGAHDGHAYLGQILQNEVHHETITALNNERAF